MSELDNAQECTEEQPCKPCSAGIRDLGYGLYDEPGEVRLAVHGTPWETRASEQDEMDTVGTLRPKLARLAESEGIPPVRVIEKSREQLQADRARLIAASGMSEAMLFERGKAFELYPEHRAIYETVTAIDFLLGDSKADQDPSVSVEETPHA